MAPPKIFAALAVAALSICGANAGPCRPLTTTTVATSTTVASTTSTAAPTSTAPSCSNEQIVVNPSFEDDAGSPWAVYSGSFDGADGHNSDTSAYFQTYSEGGGSVVQTLPHVEPGTYQLSFFYTVKTWSPWFSGSSFGCTWYGRVGGQVVASGSSDPGGAFYGSWDSSSGSWTTAGADNVNVQVDVSCNGEYDFIAVLADDITLTKQCASSP
ncbi:hypothetical protein BGZ63DRAFT_378924 [Mariannaea sp. PMI_226]|nr:hypothetical protein BGZ63DRAFT_378924 [Mariannaea sp. PMI_226]